MQTFILSAAAAADKEIVKKETKLDRVERHDFISSFKLRWRPGGDTTRQNLKKIQITKWLLLLLLLLLLLMVPLLLLLLRLALLFFRLLVLHFCLVPRGVPKGRGNFFESKLQAQVSVRFEALAAPTHHWGDAHPGVEVEASGALTHYFQRFS